MSRIAVAVSLFAVCLSFSAAWLLAADEKAKTFDDPKVAAEKDPDFKIQGEYVGEFTDDQGEKTKVAAQVIALGGGKFEVVAYKNGLPGEGAEKLEENNWKAETINGEAVFTTDNDRVTIRDGVLSVTRLDGGDTWLTLNRIERKSPTLGAKPPTGAVVLFDGTKKSLEANWQPGAKMTEGGLLMQGVTTKPTFTDFTVHVEFRLPYMPEARGQGRGNSGIYLGGRHEVQMLDSFGLEGKHNECGGIYSVRDPNVNMCLPPLSWQTYDIDYTAARFDADGKKTSEAKVTVRHNGVVIHENVPVGKPTTAAPNSEEKGPGPIHLQDHGNPVRYRNIWVVPRS